MPVIDNPYTVDESNYAYSPSDMDLSHKNMSQQDINHLIDSLCKTRMENPDVMLMDQIKNQHQFIDPILQEQRELEQDNIAVEEEVLKSIFESDTPMTAEEHNELVAKGLYDRYKYMQARKQGKTVQQLADEEVNAMSDIEAELRASLSKPLTNEATEIIQEVAEPVSFPTEEKISDGTGEINIPVEGTTLSSEDTESPAETVISIFEEGEKVTEENKSIKRKEVFNKIMGLPNFVAGMNEPYVDNSSMNEVLTELGDTVEKISSGEAIQEAMDTVKTEVVEEDDYAPMTAEEFNDVPATEISLPDEVITDALTSQYEDVDAKDAAQLISVMNRYKAHEKFNVFEALPQSIKSVILKEAAAVGADKSTINFFAKSFINDLVNNTYLDREIKDFNEELATALAPMGNIVGTMMDEYNDEVYDNFTAKLIEKAEEIKEKDPDKAKQLYNIASNFDQAVNLTRIFHNLEQHPEIANKNYKYARDSWNTMVREYDQAISLVSPKPRDLYSCYKGIVAVGFQEDYAKALIAIVSNEVEEAVKNGSLEEHIYAYYLTNSLMNLNYTANNSKTIEMIKYGVDKCIDLIDKYMISIRGNRKLSKKEKRRAKKMNNPARK